MGQIPCMPYIPCIVLACFGDQAGEIPCMPYIEPASTGLLVTKFREYPPCPTFFSVGQCRVM